MIERFVQKVNYKIHKVKDRKSHNVMLWQLNNKKETMYTTRNKMKHETELYIEQQQQLQQQQRISLSHICECRDKRSISALNMVLLTSYRFHV